MKDLIKVDINEKQEQVVSGRELHEFLQIETPYHIWFPRMIEYGFIKNVDFSTLEQKCTKGRPATDHAITIDMAKELSMIQRNEKGKQARQYFIQLEKRWNSPEAVMARALKIADTKLISLQSTVKTLETENKLLTQQQLEWADRKLIEALVKKCGGKIGYSEAWRDFKKELLYAHSININLRVTNHMNATGKKTKPKTLAMIHDDELPACLSTAVALCKLHDVQIEEILNKFKEV